MSLEEIKNLVTDQGKAWEQFKQKNDERLKEIEAKKAADPLLTEQLSKINSFMDESKSKIDLLEKAAVRTESGAAGEAKENANEVEYKKAFVSFLRKGNENGLAELQQKAMSVGSDPDGGYLVTPAMSRTINKAIFETSPMRLLASVETISTDSLDIIDDVISANAGWTSETGAISDSTTPTIGKRNIPTHELYSQPKATQKLLEDSGIDVEAWLANKTADVLARTENTAFISGTGAGQPRGILSYAAGTSWGQIEQVASGTSSVVTADKIMELFYSLKDSYAQRSTFLMNRLIALAVRQLKDGQGNYLWQQSVTAGNPDMLLGRPVAWAADMPVAAANSLSIAVGDFKTAYQIVDRKGITILRDPFTEKPFVKFYTTKRVGGDVINFEAIKIMKLGA